MRDDNQTFASFHSFVSEVCDIMADFVGSFHEIFKIVNLSLGYGKPKEGRKSSKAGQARRDGDFHLLEHLKAEII